MNPAPCGRPDCPTEERRQSERRRTSAQNYMWCARLMGIVIISTSVVSVSTAVSVSQFLSNQQEVQVRYSIRSMRERIDEIADRVPQYPLRP